MLKGLTLTLILIGYLCIAVFGTGVKDVFQWPGLLLIGIGFMITPIAFKHSIFQYHAFMFLVSIRVFDATFKKEP